MGESAQVMILMDDTLALEQGAPILGSVPFVSYMPMVPKSLFLAPAPVII